MALAYNLDFFEISLFSLKFVPVLPNENSTTGSQQICTASQVLWLHRKFPFPALVAF